MLYISRSCTALHVLMDETIIDSVAILQCNFYTWHCEIRYRFYYGLHYKLGCSRMLRRSQPRGGLRSYTLPAAPEATRKMAFNIHIVVTSVFLRIQVALESTTSESWSLCA